MVVDEQDGDEQTTARLSRRGALGAVAGAIVGAVAASATPAEATTGQPLLLGEQNIANTPTSLSRTPTADPAPTIEILNFVDQSGTVGSGASMASNLAGLVGYFGDTVVTPTVDFTRAGTVGIAVGLPGVFGLSGNSDPFALTYTARELRAGTVGLSADSPGVLGIVGLLDSPTPVSVTARVFPRAGVVGLSPNSQGILGMVGFSQAQALTVTADWTGFLRGGVVGLSDDAAGLLGIAGASNVVRGVTATAGWIGVRGVALDPTAVGVEAVGAGHGLALNVIGSVSFSSSGRGTIPANAVSFVVADKAVKASSSVFVSLLGNPGLAAVKWTELKPGVSFTIHLTRASSTKVPFAYFRLN